MRIMKYNTKIMTPETQDDHDLIGFILQLQAQAKQDQMEAGIVEIGKEHRITGAASDHPAVLN